MRDGEVGGMAASTNIIQCFIQQNLSSQSKASSSALCKKGETCQQRFSGTGAWTS